LFLIAWGADVNSRDSAGFTPLHLAVKDIEQHKNFSTIKKLIFKGASPRSKDSTGKRPINFVSDIKD
jgi:ankyrin repeat protein